MKDIPTSPRIALIKRKRKILRLRLIVLFTILFISIIGALSYFSFNSRVSINNIVITGNSIIDTNEIEAHIKERMTGKYIGLFSKSNFLIYPHNKIYNDLIISFPRIENLSIKRQGFNTINVVINERAGSYLYCGLILPEEKNDVGENCYFVNNDGFIFDKAPYFSGDVYLKFYTNINGDISKPLNSQIFTVERFHEIIRFIDNVTSLGFKPAYLVVSDNNIYSLYLKSVNLNSKPKIVFKEDNVLPVIFDNLSVSMSKPEFANEINSKYDILSYIDLRFKNKVLYKFQ